MGGVFMIGVSAENRASAGVAAGDKVDVEWHVLSIEGAKTAETRQRRIATSVGALGEGRPR
jgi:hypothetical protein